jgi:hypothetical protein
MKYNEEIQTTKSLEYIRNSVRHGMLSVLKAGAVEAFKILHRQYSETRLRLLFMSCVCPSFETCALPTTGNRDVFINKID